MASVHHPDSPVDVGPALRATGFRLGYNLQALGQAAACHARTGSVEACLYVDQIDVPPLDRAADDDRLAAYAAAVGPPETWEPWCDREVWEPTEPTAGDVTWWAIETRDVPACVMA